jgi:hypothetical protein
MDERSTRWAGVTAVIIEERASASIKSPFSLLLAKLQKFIQKSLN